MNKLLLLLLLSGQFIHGQNRGYLGKKFSIEVNAATTLSFANVLSSYYSRYKDLENKSFEGYRFNKDYQTAKMSKAHINLYPEVNINATIGRRVDFGICASYDRFNLYLPDRIFLGSTSTIINYTPGLRPNETDYSTSYFIPEEVFRKGIAISTEAYFRFYSKKYIAPAGIYHQFGFGVTSISLKNNSIDGVFTSQPLNNNILIDFENSDDQIKLSKQYISNISYTFGSKKIFSNFFYINTGIQVKIFTKQTLKQNAGASKSNKNTSVVNGRSGSYNYSTLFEMARFISFEHFAQFKIGIGKLF